MIPSHVQMGKAMDVEDVNALHVVKLFGKVYQVSHHVVISSCDTGADECRQANLVEYASIKMRHAFQHRGCDIRVR